MMDRSALEAMGRDELARHLYIHAHDEEDVPDSWRAAGAEEWDAKQATPDDVADCYAQADWILAGEQA
jgi:hypothetical protein